MFKESLTLHGTLSRVGPSCAVTRILPSEKLWRSMSFISHKGVYFSHFPGFPGGYNNSVDCVWVIRAADHVELTIVQMHLERGKGEYCVFDSLTIYDGKFFST